jgi:hypothetical protein
MTMTRSTHFRASWELNIGYFSHRLKIRKCKVKDALTMAGEIQGLLPNGGTYIRICLCNKGYNFIAETAIQQ